MSSGYRNVIFAAVCGLILIGVASPEGNGREAQNQKTTQAFPNLFGPTPGPVQKPDKAPDLEQPCEHGRDNRKSDLCAQWKAADAAKDAAEYAGYQTWIAACGLIIGLLTLGAAGAAAWFARDAAKHTKRSADEAVNANALATSATRDQERALAVAESSADAARSAASASAQQAKALEESISISKINTSAVVAVNRGWITIEDIRFTKITANDQYIGAEFTFTITNRGRSPCHKVNVRSHTEVFSTSAMFLDMDSPSPKFPHNDYYWRVDIGDILFPTQSKSMRSGASVSLQRLDPITLLSIGMTEYVCLACDLRVYYNSASALGMTEVRFHIGSPIDGAIKRNGGNIDPETIPLIPMPGGTWAQ